MFILCKILAQFKEGWANKINPQVSKDACNECRYTWRERHLNPVFTLQLSFLQIIHGNTACADLPHLANDHFSASAYCQARKRLPLEVIRQVVRGVIAALVASTREVSLWHGHRLWLADGTSFSMPDTPALQKHFGQPGGQKPGCGFPVASLLVLCDAITGLIVDVLPRALRVHDLSGVVHLHARLCRGDLLVADRAFSSFAHNLVRMVMLEAARRQQVPVARISFVDALRWIAHRQPGSPLGNLRVNPDRPGRIEPRACKRRPKQYDRLTRPRNELRKQVRAKTLNTN